MDGPPTIPVEWLPVISAIGGVVVASVFNWLIQRGKGAHSMVESYYTSLQDRLKLKEEEVAKVREDRDLWKEKYLKIKYGHANNNGG